MRTVAERARVHAQALGVYLLLLPLALDRLLFHVRTLLPGSGQRYDYAIFHWDLWWMRHALVELQTIPLQTNYIVYPFTHSLVTHTFVPFWGLLALPLQPMFNLTTIFNLFIILSFLLTAYCTFLFLFRHDVPLPPAVLAGAVFAFSPALVHRATEGHLNMLPMWWLPLSLLLIDAVCTRPRLRNVLLLAGALYAGVLTDLQFIMWQFAVAVPYALYRLWQTEKKALRQRRLVALGLTAALFSLLFLIYPLWPLTGLETGSFPAATLETAQAYSFPPAALLQAGRADFTVGRLLFPLTLLAALAAGVRRRRWLWLLIGAAAFVLALGPSLAIGDGAALPLPYLLLHRAFQGLYRAPVRFAVLTTFCFTLFAAFSAQALIARHKLGPRTVILATAALGIAFIFDYGLPAQFPTFAPAAYETYEQIGEDERSPALLNVPLGVDAGYTLFGHGQQLIYYQPQHEKPTPTGALSRMPRTAIDHFRSYNVLEAMAGEAPLSAAAQGELTELIEEWNVGYVAIHRDLLDDEALLALPPFFTLHPALCPWRTERDLLVYRVPSPEEGCPQRKRIDVDLGAPTDAAYVGSGWYLPEDVGGVQARWAGPAPTATVRLDLTPAASTLRFRALAYPQAQTVTVRVNGSVVGSATMPRAWTTYRMQVPAALIEENAPAIVQFVHEKRQSAHEQTGGESPDQRPLGAAYSSIIVEAQRP